MVLFEAGAVTCDGLLRVLCEVVPHMRAIGHLLGVRPYLSVLLALTVGGCA